MKRLLILLVLSSALPFSTFGATLGKTDIGGSQGTPHANYSICNQYTTPNWNSSTIQGQVDNMLFYFSGVIDTAAWSEMALYDTSNSVPYNKLIVSEITNNAAGWTTHDVTSTYVLLPDTAYWICHTHSDNVAGHSLRKYDAGMTNNYDFLNVAPPPDRFRAIHQSAGTEANMAISMYLNYATSTISGGGSSPTSTTDLGEVTAPLGIIDLVIDTIGVLLGIFAIWYIKRR